ncbi:hypothetical protein FACS1894184_13050 [Clostridia bacterium]|nr:hypothetical protein FACS1894184_13050 [Clostridia bacterium]
MELRDYLPDSWTIEDEYDSMPHEIHAELIDGIILLFEMPTIEHNDAAGEICLQLKLYLRGKHCRALYDTRVQLDKAKSDVLRPDVMLVCDRSKIHLRRVIGVPDLIVEVLSPSNHKHDTHTKRDIYQHAGVPEYWMVDTRNKYVEVLILRDGYYVPTVYHAADSIKVSVLDDCVIELEYVFPDDD